MPRAFSTLFTACTVAAALGIGDFRAEVLSVGKHALVKELQTSDRIVAMAGDGVNAGPWPLRR